MIFSSMDLISKSAIDWYNTSLIPSLSNHEKKKAEFLSYVNREMKIIELVFSNALRPSWMTIEQNFDSFVKEQFFEKGI